MRSTVTGLAITVALACLIATEDVMAKLKA